MGQRVCGISEPSAQSFNEDSVGKNCKKIRSILKRDLSVAHRSGIQEGCRLFLCGD